MASLNRVQIIGNLGQDPELRYTQNQVPVCTLNVATTEYRTLENGEKEANTTWHRVVVWNKQAENCNKFLSKGRQVYIEGRLQNRQWEDQNGNKRYTTEVVAQSVLFLGGAAGASKTTSSEGDYSAPSPSAMGADPSLDDIPF